MKHILSSRMLAIGTILVAMATSSWAAEAATKLSATASKPAASAPAAITATAPAAASQPADLVLGDSDQISPGMPVTPDGKYGMMTIMRAGQPAGNPPNMPPGGPASMQRSTSLYIVDLDSGTPREVTGIETQNAFARVTALSPDSAYGLAEVHAMLPPGGSTLYVINLKTGKATAIESQNRAMAMTWVGDRIAMIEQSGQHELSPLKLASADGKDIKQSELCVYVVASTRDGKLWAGAGNADDLKTPINQANEKSMTVMLLTPEGKVVRQLGSASELRPPIALSPNGAFVAATKRVRTPQPTTGSSRAIVVMDVKTGQSVDISDNVAPLAVTDDGRLIAMENQGSGADAKAKLSIYDAAGIPAVLVEDAVCVGVSDKKAFYCIRKDDMLEFGSKDLPPAKK